MLGTMIVVFRMVLLCKLDLGNRLMRVVRMVFRHAAMMTMVATVRL
jgi:hypothetical protein